MGKYDYDKEKHSNPDLTLSLDEYYFVVHKNKLLLFLKKHKANKEATNK